MILPYLIIQQPVNGLMTLNCSINKIMEKGYTEYGYRGLEEIKKLRQEIQELKKYIKQLEDEKGSKQ